MSRAIRELLEHPALWRGRSAAQSRTFPTGFSALDEGLPGGGWPQTGLIEILPRCFGVGELPLLLPALAAVTRRSEARWCAWVAPPLQPFAPALAERGVALERMLIVQEPAAGRGSGCGLWAFEQVLRSGACDIALAWARQPAPGLIRRLHLAAQRGATLGVLFRPRQAAREPSAAVLRMAVEPAGRGGRVTLLKSRGGARGTIELAWE